MATLKNNRLRASLTLLLSALFLFGVFFMVKGMDRNDKVEKQNETVKADELFTFEYTGSNFSKTAVENEANWSIAPSNELCDGAEEVPCRIQVSSTYVNNPTSSPTLKTSANIAAALNSSTGTHYVNSMADPSGVISNREN